MMNADLKKVNIIEQNEIVAGTIIQSLLAYGKNALANES
jgi:hypothetical protein